MSQFLTAAKIAFLTLTDLYCQSAVPDSAVVEYLSFLVGLVSPVGSGEVHEHRNLAAPQVIASVNDLENLEALKLPSTVPGRSLFDLFVKRLWDIDSLDALHQFIQDAERLYLPSNTENEYDQTANAGLVHITLSRTSPLGLFVRRVRLEFTRLQFADTLQLWVAFIKFKEASFESWRRQSRAAGSFDRVLQDLDLDHDTELARIAYEGAEEPQVSRGVVSVSDVERILEFQLERMQRLNERIPADMRVQLREMLSKLPSTPSLSYFLQFFEAWRAGDYHGAFDSLHRYFDHTLQAREKTYYQYALLHMAILHADFGCFSEAVAAMNEAIATARENQDIACLNFCLNWLNFLRKAHSRDMRSAAWSSVLSGPEKDSLVFLKTKAKEMKMWPLLSSTLLGEAEHEMSMGESMGRVFEHVYQSSHVIMQHSITENMGAQLLLQSSIYARMGFDVLSSAYCNLLSDCYGDICPRDEIVRTICRKAAHMTMYGQYREAQGLLQTCDEDFHGSVKLHKQVSVSMSLVNLTRAIRRIDHAAAEYAVQSLASADSVDPDISFNFRVLEYEYQLRNNNFDAASSVIDDLAETIKSDDADVYQNLELALLKARLFVHSGLPEWSFTMSLRVASAAQRVGLLPTLWTAICLLCTALVSLREFQAAISLLDAIIPQAHEGRDFDLLGQLYNIQADAHVGLLGLERGDKSTKQTSSAWKAGLYLDRAEQFFQKVEDQAAVMEVCAKKAILAELRGDHNMATSLASKVANFTFRDG